MLLREYWKLPFIYLFFLAVWTLSVCYPELTDFWESSSRGLIHRAVSVPSAFPVIH